MSRPNPPRSLQSVARRHWAALLAPAYLFALVLLRRKFPSGAAFPAAASAGFLAFLAVIVWNLIRKWRDDRVPEREAILVWAGVAALELHALVPAVAWSRTVPAALFFLVGLLLPAHRSVPVAVGCAAWIPAMVRDPSLILAEGVAAAAMALLAGGAGLLVRRRLRNAPGGEDPVRAAIARSRSMVLPWEEPQSGGSRPGGEATEESALLRREIDLREGVRRGLESVLPLAGISHAAYLATTAAPGAQRLEGFLVSLGRRDPREFSVPDTYVPVREATVFQRPFLERGPGSARYSPWERGEGVPPTGIAAVPVLREGVVEGVLLAVREEEGHWGEPVLPLLELAAYFLGRDIDRVRALHRGERYLLREDWYHQMVRKMAQVRPSEEGEGDPDLRTRRERVYSEAATQVRRQAGASRVLLIASSDGGQKGWIAWEETGSGGRCGELPESLGETYVGWVIRTGSQRLFSEAAGPPRSQGILPVPWEVQGEQSFLVLPVGAPGGFHGAVVCAHPSARRFQRQHADLVRDIAEVLLLGLSHVEHLEALTLRAATDGLTGLANRKAFLARLEEDVARLDGRHPAAVVMLDIDHFKRINDTYGHPYGDEVLRRVAGILGKAVRKGDAAGRYGGEEFVLYLHMADPDKAREVAERFRRMIRQARFRNEGREVVVTASLGVACSPAHGKSAEELVRCADAALYLSKQRGRDRVTVYPG
jgi:diguanylate cyclase (GGDEF)-like protein